MEEVISGFFIDSSNNNNITNNHITLSNINYGSGSSSPLVFAWNGEKYGYTTDVGGVLPYTTSGADYAAIKPDALVPKDGKYSMKITEEYNEIVFYDKLKLMTFDHIPGYRVLTSFMKADKGNFYTVSNTPSNPIQSCVDNYGHDCKADLEASDDQWTYRDPSNFNSWIMDFGDTSGAAQTKLVLQATRDYSVPAAPHKFIQVKNAQGEWVDIYDPNPVWSISGADRTYVVDLTGKFLSSDHHIRIGMDRARLNYAAIDTSAPISYTVNSYSPDSVDLGFHGYTAIDKTIFWKHNYDIVSPVPEQKFAPQTGNFTKYGDVTPLLSDTDNKFVVMHHGDQMSVEFPYVPKADGTVRDFIIDNWATYKHANTGPTGKTVEPLPFNGMTSYPYQAPEAYPMTADNINYIKTWNTRTITDSPFGMSLPNSVNTTVRGNTIINPSDSNFIGDKGIYITGEIDSTIDDNTVEGFYNGIVTDNSTGITITNNHVSNVIGDAIQGEGVTNLIISGNTITNTTSNGDGIQAQGVNGLTITNNIINHTTDDGIYFSQSYNIIVSGNTVDHVYDNALDIEEAGDYAVSNNTLASTSNTIDIDGEYSPYNGNNGSYHFDGAYSGTHVWHTLYTLINNQTFLSRDVDLTSATTSATLTFKKWAETEPCCDGLRIAVSTNGGGAWTDLNDNRENTGGLWEDESFDLTPYIGGVVKIRFEFFTDGSVTEGDGVYLDNIGVTADSTSIFSDTMENGINGWKRNHSFRKVVGNSKMLALRVKELEILLYARTFTNNTLTSDEGYGVHFANVGNISFIHNTMSANGWVMNDNDTNLFNDTDSGNTYYKLDGTKSWDLFDIKDSHKNGYADTGKDLPFNQTVLGRSALERIRPRRIPSIRKKCTAHDLWK
jgi:parallel beta-helix repeat protein